MMRKIDKWCDRILSPIANNLVFFVISFILLFAPAVIRDYSDVRYWIMAIPISIALAYIVSSLVTISNSKIVKITLYLVLSIVTLIEAFIIISFGTRFSALIIRLMLETNPDEAVGFFTLYVIPYLLYIVIFIVLYVSLIYILEKRVKPIEFKSYNPIIKTASSIAIILLVSLVVVRDIREVRLLRRNNNIATIFQSRLGFVYGGLYTSYGLLVDAFNNWLITSKDIDELAITLKQPIVVDPLYKSSHICIIIGESFNKHHASVYDYHLNTTPALNEELSAGRLFVFNDVVTPVNATIEAMQLFSSFSNKDNNLKWSQTPLLPRLYKLSGYYCSFISNSEVKLSEESVWDTKNNYWVSEKTAPLMFDTQNTQRYKYDHELLQELENIDPVTKDNSFTMIHLLGQHADYVDRYPKEFTKFTYLDYVNPSLEIAQKEGIAHYDNATFYNDYVVNQIFQYYKDIDAIVVYFSDHGEEVHDYRNFIGRSHEGKVTPGRAKYQFEVPFMIWMSDVYKRNHPEVVAQVERALDRPYMIDDLPHMMLDIAGIECEWFDPTRSVINDRFNQSRKRLLLDLYQDYDEIMKQEVL